MTLENLIEKYSEIENKIPSIFKDYTEAGLSLKKDLANHIGERSVMNYEFARVLSLLSRVEGCSDLSKYIHPLREYQVLYPDKFNFNALKEVELPKDLFKDINIDNNKIKEIKTFLKNK